MAARSTSKTPEHKAHSTCRAGFSPPAAYQRPYAFFRHALLIFSIVYSMSVAAEPPGSGRVALIIGNGAYKAVDRLANPANDAALMAKTLQAAGFTLVGGGPQIDVDKPRFEQLVQQFGQDMTGAGVALFYYSGHGMQVQGVNWLVPVDANPTGTRDLDFQMIDANLVLRQMEDAGTKLNMVILDACRNNPFAVRGLRGSQAGLAEMHVPEGTLISYATQPGNVAADGRGGNSPYTAALADAMHQPHQDVFRVFNQVGLTVKQETGGKQQPWLASSPISGEFYFLPNATAASEPVLPISEPLPRRAAQPAPSQVSDRRSASHPDILAKTRQARLHGRQIGGSYIDVYVDIDYDIINVSGHPIQWLQLRSPPFGLSNTGLSFNNFFSDESDAPLCPSSSTGEPKICGGHFKDLPAGLSHHHATLRTQVFDAVHVCDVSHLSSIDASLTLATSTTDGVRFVELNDRIRTTGHIAVSGCPG